MKNPEYREIIRGADYTTDRLDRSDFHEVQFIGCGFSGCNLSDIHFYGCRFEKCDFSGVRLERTLLADVSFTGCKLLGVRFDYCNPFNLGFRFEECLMSYASFYQLKIPGTVFFRCRMNECDLAGADLTGTDFSGSDLAGALFENSNLGKADFRTALNYTVNPVTDRMKKAKFSMDGLAGLLAFSGIEIE